MEITTSLSNPLFHILQKEKIARAKRALSININTSGLLARMFFAWKLEFSMDNLHVRPTLNLGKTNKIFYYS